MCRELDALRQSMMAYAGGFDARSLTPAQAEQVVGVCSRVEASIASVKALAAARAAEGSGWRADGYRSPAEHLAHQAGMSPSSARRALETGRRMADQPAVAQAALAGELSAEQANAVSDGAAVNPARTADLLDKARRLSLPELNAEVARVKAAASDLEARRRAIHAKRSLRRWTDRQGAFQAHVYGLPEDGVDLSRMLDPIRRRLNLARRSAGQPVEELEALDYDALMLVAALAAGHDAELTVSELIDLGLFPGLAAGSCPSTPPIPARQPRASSPHSAGGLEPDGQLDLLAQTLSGTESGADPTGPAPDAIRSVPAAPGPAPGPGRGPGAAGTGSEEVPAEPGRRRARRRARKLAGGPTRVMIRVDLDTLLRGRVADDELCEIAGCGPVPVSVVRDVLAGDDPLLIALLTRSRDIVGVCHLGRRPDAYQRSALDFAQPTCAVTGCNATAGLQYDHRVDWSRTKFTVYDWLDRLCPHHHKLKTHRGWALTTGGPDRYLVPPEDPRHPRHQPAPTLPTPVGADRKAGAAPSVGAASGAGMSGSGREVGAAHTRSGGRPRGESPPGPVP